MFEWLPKLDYYTAHVPGKLFVAGEYAVLEPGNPAILFAVDQYLSCTVTKSDSPHHIQLTSELSELMPLQFKRQDVLPTEPQWCYVLSAIQVVEQLISEYNRPLQCYRLHFATELIDEHGAKYGLGSSGAVTVATIKALLAFYGIGIPSTEILFKLAAIALTRIKNTGSLADIAANCYGGWIFYQSLNRTWLISQLTKQIPLIQLLTDDWPCLKIEPLKAPEHLQVFIGWTASPALTDHHVQSFNAQKSQYSVLYQQFIRDSALNVHRIKSAFISEDWEQLQQGLQDARQLLLSLDSTYQLSIETPALRQLIAIAEQYGYVAKSSGAGGGDCGIAFGYAQHDSNQLLHAWRHAGIIPLSLGIAPSQINE